MAAQVPTATWNSTAVAVEPATTSLQLQMCQPLQLLPYVPHPVAEPVYPTILATAETHEALAAIHPFPPPVAAEPAIQETEN